MNVARYWKRIWLGGEIAGLKFATPVFDGIKKRKSALT